MKKNITINQAVMHRSHSACSAVVLVLSVMLILIAGSCLATETAYAALGGSGTEGDPYEIRTYEDLKEFANIINGTHETIAQNTSAYGILMNDIECTDRNWVPIGSNSYPYTGHFYGADNKLKKISKLSNEDCDDVTNLNDQGLFGYVGNGGMIKYLGVEDGKIVGGGYVGGIAGEVFGTITNCYYTGEVSGNRYIGGVAGINFNTLTNCYSMGIISGVHRIGGVTGQNYQGTIINCYNTAAVNGTGQFTGGLAGNNYGGTIKNCYNIGPLDGNEYIGGITGAIFNNGTISNCYFDKTLSVVADAIGDSSSGDNVKGLDTYQMTGISALSEDNMAFSYSGDETNPWITKANGYDEISNTYCMYYPHLTGFDLDSDGKQINAADIATADWPSKLIVDVKWNEPDSYMYNGNARNPIVTSITVSQKQIEVPVGVFAVQYLRKTNGSWEYVDSVAPTVAGTYKLVITYDENTTDETVFNILDPNIDYEVKYYKQIDIDVTTHDPIWSTDEIAEAVDVGTYKAVVSFTDDFYLEREFEIDHASLTVKAKNQEIQKGEDIVSGVDQAEISGAAKGHSLSEVTLTAQGEQIIPSEAKVQDAYGNDVTENYDITYEPGTITVVKYVNFDGKGTEESPYELKTYDDLKEFAAIVNGTHDKVAQNTSACAKLMNDIECTDNEWVPIGNHANNYSITYYGHFDGNGFTIKNLSNGESTADYQGLFGCIVSGGKVENVGLIDGEIKGKDQVGGIAGFNKGTITNCYNTGAVIGSANQIGGVAGENNDGTITNCYNTGTVNGKHEIGGVVGSNYNTESPEESKIINCFNTGTVSGRNNVGGMVGFNEGYENEAIANCYYDNNFSLVIDEAAEYIYDSETVKGLSTSQMTGTSALSNMVFSYADGETSPWLTKPDGVEDEVYYWYYPHLKGFDLDSNGKQIDATDISSEDWPAKLIFDAKWKEPDSKLYDEDAHQPTVTSITVSQKPIEIPEDALTVQYFKKTPFGWGDADSAVPTDPGIYKLAITYGDNTTNEIVFIILDPNTDYEVKYYKQIGNDDTSGDPVWSTDDLEEAVDAGTYKAVITFEDKVCFEKLFKIEHAPLTIKAKDQTIKESESINSSLDQAEISGLLEGHSLNTVNLTAKGEQIVPSGAKIVDAHGNDVTENYDIKYEPGTLTVSQNEDIDDITPDDPTADDAEVDDTIPTVKTGKIHTVGNITKKLMKVKFPTSSKVTNYRIQYRLAGKAKWTSAWSKGTDTYVIKNLKKYSASEFRIAGYKKLADGTWVRGKWSNISRRYMSAVSQKPLKAGKRKLTVTWKKDKKASGYQIKYSLKKNMSDAKTVTVSGRSKTSRTIKKLKKGKTYYVQIRPYKAKSRKKYLGILSGKKSAKVK